MAWNLQQINNVGAPGPSVPNEFVGVLEATAPNPFGMFVCTFGNQQHFTCVDGRLTGNLQDCWYDGDG